MNGESLLSQFNGLHALILGDVMVDRYLSGNIDRISPEAPVPVLDQMHVEDRLGGAANVALNIAALGANPLIISVVGSDHEGHRFRSLLNQSGISDHYILETASRPTTLKTRVLAKNQQLLRIDRESRAFLSEAEVKELSLRIDQVLDTRNIKVVIIQDYNKGVCTEQLIRKVIVESIKRDIPVVVDPKSKEFFTYKRCSLFKPNLKEAMAQTCQLSGKWGLSELHEIGEILRTKLGKSEILITLSDKGMYYNDGVKFGIAEARVRKVADVSGAGDSVISVAALGKALGLDLELIAHLANVAGGQVCEEPGVVAIDRNKFLKEVSTNQLFKDYPIG